jgi:hypothetical protein
MLDDKAYGTSMHQYLSRSAKALKEPEAGYPRREELHGR